MFRDCVSSARARKRWSKFLMEQTNNNKKERFEEGRMNANFVLTFERNLPEKNIFLCLFVNLLPLLCKGVFYCHAIFLHGIANERRRRSSRGPIAQDIFGPTKGSNMMMFAFEIFNKSGCERVFEIFCVHKIKKNPSFQICLMLWTIF